jgi:hypothetical protein
MLQMLDATRPAADQGADQAASEHTRWLLSVAAMSWKSCHNALHRLIIKIHRQGCKDHHHHATSSAAAQARHWLCNNTGKHQMWCLGQRPTQGELAAAQLLQRSSPKCRRGQELLKVLQLYNS